MQVGITKVTERGFLSEEQQRIRKGRIGASQACWLYGLGYNGEGWGELYLDLHGKLPQRGLPKDPAALVRDPRWQGFNMEGYAARAWQEVHRMNLECGGQTYVWRGETLSMHPWMWHFLAASPDGLVWNDCEPVAGWECKLTKRKKDYFEDLIECDFGTVSDGWGEEGTDQVPFRHAIQCQQNMLVTGLDTWHLTLIHNADPYFYVVKRNQAFIDDLVDRAYRFYFLHFLAGVPPPATGQTQQRLLGLSTPSGGDYIEADDMARKLTLDLATASDDIAFLEARKEEIQTTFMEHMKALAGDQQIKGVKSQYGKACWVRGNDGRSYVRLYPTEELSHDVKKLKETRDHE